MGSILNLTHLPAGYGAHGNRDIKLLRPNTANCKPTLSNNSGSLALLLSESNNDTTPLVKTVPMGESDLLRGFRKEWISWFENHSIKIDFDVGDYIAHEGHRAAGLYLLVSGTAYILNEESMPIFAKTGGDVIGEVNLFDQQERSASVVAATPVSTRLLTSGQFEALVTHDIDFAFALVKNLYRVLSSSLRRTHRQLVEQS